ncbi:MAG: GNAT family N-acetyltransferase [Flavobacterium sp.]|nr:GNAT family N-acetyltransferase [Flavobacterium sp.]
MNKDQKINPTLVTELLTLRPLSVSDAEEILQLRSDSKINKYIDRKPSKTLDDAVSFINSIIENSQCGELFYMAITKTSEEKLIGTICLFDFAEDEKKCEIGYELLPEFHGRGFMIEALKQVVEYASLEPGLNMMDAWVHKENLKSINILDKLHFKKLDDVREGNSNLDLFRYTRYTRHLPEQKQ